MRRIYRTILAAVLVTATVVLSAAPEASGDVIDDNRELLTRWRDDPAHYARLQNDLALFRQFPAEKQERLRKLDHDLQDEAPGMRTRLTRVMDRYADWLDRLPEADRHSIDKAPDRQTRLQRIRDIREQQWLKRQPRARQEIIAKASPDERPKLLHRFRDEDHDQRADWQVAARHSDMLLKREALPARFEQLPDEVKKYVAGSVVPLLSKDDERRLREAEGKWPRYMRVLVEQIDNHPVSVLGPIGPTHADDSDLPPPVRDLLGKLEKSKKFARLNEAKGKWPEYGVVLLEMRRSALAKFPPPVNNRFMPSRPGDFPNTVQVFIEKRLLPALDEEDRIRLHNANGRWPAYQKLIVELARKHNLPVPLEKPLPGSFEFYDRYRARSVTPEKKGPEPVVLGQ